MSKMSISELKILLNEPEPPNIKISPDGLVEILKSDQKQEIERIKVSCKHCEGRGYTWESKP